MTSRKKIPRKKSKAVFKDKDGNELDEKLTKPDWNGSCEVCDMSPIVPLTGMCGPCTFGEAETINGNW